MKIIKEGNFEVPKAVRFLCDICGCEFEADRDDGEFDWELKIAGFQSFVLYSADCPCCSARLQKPRAIQNYNSGHIVLD